MPRSISASRILQGSIIFYRMARALSGWQQMMVFFFNRTSQYLQPVLNNNKKLGNITALDFDSSGRLWTGSLQQGLYLTDTASRKVLEQYYPDSRNPYGLTGQQVLYIHSDAQTYL